jgi:hypothetical protein
MMMRFVVSMISGRSLSASQPIATRSATPSSIDALEDQQKPARLL